jgi:hypothetical protein
MLFVAMAGPHQIWSHPLGADHIGVYAGTGREDVLNGTRDDAAFAQPSGLASDGKFLFVVDSEGSAVRKISLAKAGLVSTIAGTSELPAGRSLFEFGDVDGAGAKARLQHPLGIAYRDGVLYVADSYNHKIKRIDVAKVQTTTWIGDGKPGDRVDPPRLSEPAGLALAKDRLYIADTNNHRIAVVDLGTAKLSVLEIEGLTPPQPAVGDEDHDFAGGKNRIAVEPRAIAPAAELRLEVAVTLPEDYKLNERGPVSLRIGAAEDQKLVAAEELQQRHRGRIEEGKLLFAVPLAASSGTATLDVDASFTYCRDGTGGVCKLKTASWRIPVTLAEKAAEKVVKLELTVD